MKDLLFGVFAFWSFDFFFPMLFLRIQFSPFRVILFLGIQWFFQFLKLLHDLSGILNYFYTNKYYRIKNREILGDTRIVSNGFLGKDHAISIDGRIIIPNSVSKSGIKRAMKRINHSFIFRISLVSFICNNSAEFEVHRGKGGGRGGALRGHRNR